MRPPSVKEDRCRRFSQGHTMTTIFEEQPFLTVKDTVDESEEQRQACHEDLENRFLIDNKKKLYLSSKTTKITVLVSMVVFCIWSFVLAAQTIYHLRAPSFPPKGSYIEVKDFNRTNFGWFAENARYYSCGDTVEEARSVGCIYDILISHWLPYWCVDEEALAQYQADGSWYGYADENRTKLLTIDEMSELPFYYTSARDHIFHCSSLWKKGFDRVHNGKRVFDPMVTDPHHTHHCADFLVKMTNWTVDKWNIPITVNVGVAGCMVKDV